MGIGKWIGGIVGFMAKGPLGALAGYAIGSLIDSAMQSDEKETRVEESYDTGGAYGQRNSFLFSMLVMASYVIKADGRVMHSEMEFVRRFLRRNFGDAAVGEGEQILLNLFEQPKALPSSKVLEKEKRLQEATLLLKKKYGKNSVLKALDLEEGATAKERNDTIGGHKA